MFKRKKKKPSDNFSVWPSNTGAGGTVCFLCPVLPHVGSLSPPEPVSLSPGRRAQQGTPITKLWVQRHQLHLTSQGKPGASRTAPRSQGRKEEKALPGLWAGACGAGGRRPSSGDRQRKGSRAGGPTATPSSLKAIGSVFHCKLLASVHHGRVIFWEEWPPVTVLQAQQPLWEHTPRVLLTMPGS